MSGKRTLDWDTQFDKFIKQYETECRLENIDAGIHYNADGAKEYAQMAIKQMSWINGGALIALPALLESLDKSANNLTYLSGMFFILGLTAVMCTAICGYFALRNSADAMSNDKQAKKWHIWDIHLGMNFSDREGRETYRQAHINSSSQAKTQHTKALSLECRGVQFFFASLILFILGTTSFFFSLQF